MAVNFTYASDNQKDRLQNTIVAFEGLLNRELEDIGANYRVKYDNPIPTTMN